MNDSLASHAMNKNQFLTLPILLILSACSTLSEKECHTSDWRQLGVQDGRAGLPERRLDDYAQSCKEYGIRPDTNQYLAGREVGLRQYCVPSNAFRTGLNGQAYQGVCPANIDMAFHINNTAALSVYQARQRIKDLDSRLDHLEHELSEKDKSEKDRLRLRKEMRDMDRDRDRLKSDLRFEEHELENRMEEERYRAAQR
ncbi:MAG: DUF2799 domain-containing protein [Gallionella sp.]|nr:DUF2799 domain-containing protein [Gallionella sp.]